MTVTATAVPYAALPVLETFEAAWQSVCATDDAPSASWRSAPPTGPRAWRRDDDVPQRRLGQPGLSAATAPSGAYGSAHSARFHSAGELFPGDKGNLDLHVNLNVPGSKVVTFDYVNSLSTDSLVVLLSG